MKRMLIITLALTMAAAALHAQPSGTHTIGARGGIAAGFNSLNDDFGWGDDYYSAPNFNFGLYYAYAIIRNVAIQAELNVHTNQRLNANNNFRDPESSQSTLELANFTYSSLDIPILLRLSTPRGRLGFLVGPHISIPLGSLSVSNHLHGVPRRNFTQDIDNFATFGFTVGGMGSFPIGPIRLVTDARFVVDINGVQVNNTTVMNRRAFVVSLGLEMWI